MNIDSIEKSIQDKRILTKQWDLLRTKHSSQDIGIHTGQWSSQRTKDPFRTGIHLTLATSVSALQAAVLSLRAFQECGDNADNCR